MADDTVPESVLETGEVFQDSERRRLEELRDGILERLKESEDYSEPRIREFEEIHSLYLGQPQRKQPWSSSLEQYQAGRFEGGSASLEMFRSVESSVSSKSSVLWGEDPNWMAYDPELTDQATSGMYHAQRLIDEGHERMNIRAAFDMALKIRELYGDCYLACWWKRNWVWKKQVERQTTSQLVQHPRTGEINGIAYEHQDTVVWKELLESQHPVAIVIPPWRFFMDPTATDPQQARWCAVVWYLSKEELQEWILNSKELGMQTYDLEDDLKPGSSTGGQSEKTSEALKKQDKVSPQPRHAYKVIDWWGINPTKPHPGKQGIMDPRIHRIVLVERKQVVIEGLNPFDHGHMPFLRSVKNPNPESLAGVGQGTLLKNLQKLLNDVDNKLNAYLQFGLYGLWSRENGPTGEDARALNLFPSRVVDVETEGRLTRIDMPAEPFDIALKVKAQRTAELRGASGANNLVQGLPSGASKMGEIREMVAESSRMIAGDVVSFANDVYRPFIRMEAQLYDQYLDPNMDIITAVPYQGRMVNIRVKKAEIPLANLMPRIKIATDAEFRKSTLRNLNQSMRGDAEMLTMLLNAMPEARGDILSAMWPAMLELHRKQMELLGSPPDNILPKELGAQIQERLQQAEAYRQRLQQMQLAMQPQGGGREVSVAQR